MLLLSSSLHKNLITHSPSTCLLIFVCVRVCVRARSVCRDRPVSLCNTQKRRCVPTTEAPFYCSFAFIISLLSSLRSSSARLIEYLFLSATMLHSVRTAARKPLRQREGAREAWNSLNETNAIHWAYSKSVLMCKDYTRLGFVMQC